MLHPKSSIFLEWHHRKGAVRPKTIKKFEKGSEKNKQEKRDRN